MSPKRSASRPSPGWAERVARVRGAQLAVVVGLAIATLLLYVNLSSSERKVEHPIPHLYATADSQFVRTMGNLLGPRSSPATGSPHSSTVTRRSPQCWRPSGRRGGRSPSRATSTGLHRWARSSPKRCRSGRGPACARTCCSTGRGPRRWTRMTSSGCGRPASMSCCIVRLAGTSWAG